MAPPGRFCRRGLEIRGGRRAPCGTLLCRGAVWARCVGCTAPPIAVTTIYPVSAELDRPKHENVMRRGERCAHRICIPKRKRRTHPSPRQLELRSRRVRSTSPDADRPVCIAHPCHLRLSLSTPEVQHVDVRARACFRRVSLTFTSANRVPQTRASVPGLNGDGPVAPHASLCLLSPLTIWARAVMIREAQYHCKHVIRTLEMRKMYTTHGATPPRAPEESDRRETPKKTYEQ